MRNKHNKKPLSNLIIEHFSEHGKDLLDLGIDLVVNPSRFYSMRNVIEGRSSRYRNSQLYNLKRNKSFRENPKKAGEMILTSHGRVMALRHRIQKKTVKQWDGKWRAIAFDIIEKHRGKRNMLRRQLRLLGCIELQKSFWITPHNILEELLCLLRIWEIEMQGDVRVFVIQKIYKDNDLKKFFDLT